MYFSPPAMVKVTLLSPNNNNRTGCVEWRTGHTAQVGGLYELAVVGTVELVHDDLDQHFRDLCELEDEVCHLGANL